MKHQGLHANRLTKSADNPREVAFAEEWDLVNTTMFGHTPVINDLLMRQAAAEHEYVLAATMAQWLGSNVGMSFLNSALARFGMEIVEKK